MATSVRLEFVSDGFRQILNSANCQQLVDEVGNRIAEAAGEGFEYESAQLGYGGGRVGGFIGARTYEAMKAEAEDKALTRAVRS